MVLRRWFESLGPGLLVALTLLLSGLGRPAQADEKTLILSETYLPHECAETLAKEGNAVFVAQHDGGIDIIDVSNQAAPVLLANLDPDGPLYDSVDIWDVQVLNGVLYAFNRGSTQDPIKGNWTGVYMYDVSVPAWPVEIGAIVWGSQPYHHLGAYTISGEVGLINGVPHVFVCSQISGDVEVFDVSNPANAVWRCSLYSPGGTIAAQTVYQNNRLYTAWGRAGFTVDDVSVVSSPVRLANQPYIGSPVINGGLQSISPTPDGLHVVTGEYTYAGDVRLWDISVPSAVTLVDSWRLGTGALLWTVHATNDYAYVAHLEDGIRILDIQSRTSLTPAGFCDPDSGAPAVTWAGISDIVIDGSTLFACHAARGLFIVEHDPYLPLPDVVTITSASYRQSKRELTVYATSSEQPTATLTVSGFGQMTWNQRRSRYEYKIRVNNRPATVTVTSSSGGSDTASVSVR